MHLSISPSIFLPFPIPFIHLPETMAPLGSSPAIAHNLAHLAVPPKSWEPLSSLSISINNIVYILNTYIIFIHNTVLQTLHVFKYVQKKKEMILGVQSFLTWDHHGIHGIPPCIWHNGKKTASSQAHIIDCRFFIVRKYIKISHINKYHLILLGVLMTTCPLDSRHVGFPR